MDSPSTFSESWHRVASQRICLRLGVRVRRQNFRGQRWFILENPFGNQFFRLRPAAYEFVGRLRPDRTVEEVWKECLERFPDDAPGQEAVMQLLSQLYLANLLQYDLAADASQLFERQEKTRQRETRSRFLNIMFLRIPLLDPDQFLVRTLPWVKHLIGQFGAMLWLIVVGVGVKTVIDNWDRVRGEGQSVLAPDNLFLLYAGLVLIKTVHEFGHAYFCRRYGGEVHVMGVMFMIFTPTPYMDATSSWGFRKRSQRALVGAAGMIVELFFAAIAVVVWANTGNGTIHSLAYNMMFVASVSTLVFNLNPLLRFDGYYILSDLLGIPNLHQRSLKHLRHLGERYLFGLKKSQSPALTRSEAAWLTVFGITSGIYRVVVFGGILLFVADRFLLIGMVMALVCAIAWVLRPSVMFINYLAASQQLARNRVRAITVSSGIAAALILLLQFVPFPDHYRAPGILESQRWTEVHTLTGGQIVGVLARPGSTVTNGQALLRIENTELDLEIAAVRASIDEVRARLRNALHGSAPDLKPLTSRLDSLTQRLNRLNRDRDQLEIRSPQSGVWTSPEIEEWIGRWMPRGTPLGMVIDPGRFEFVSTVRQEDGEMLFSGGKPGAQVRLFGEAGRVLMLGEPRIIPAEQRNLPSAALGWSAGGEVAVSSRDPQGVQAVEPFFEVRAPIADSADAVLFHGRAGKVRFDLQSSPLLPRAVRWFRQLVQKRYQL